MKINVSFTKSNLFQFLFVLQGSWMLANNEQGY